MSLSLWLWQEGREPESEDIHQNMSVFAHLSVIRFATIPVTSYNYLRTKKILGIFCPPLLQVTDKQYISRRHAIYPMRHAIYIYYIYTGGTQYTHTYIYIYIYTRDTQYICMRHAIYLFEARNISV